MNELFYSLEIILVVFSLAVLFLNQNYITRQEHRGSLLDTHVLSNWVNKRLLETQGILNVRHRYENTNKSQTQTRNVFKGKESIKLQEKARII